MVTPALSVRVGSAAVIVIVCRPPPPMLKVIQSATPTLALASSMACLKLPAPASFVFVTTKVAHRHKFIPKTEISITDKINVFNNAFNFFMAFSFKLSNPAWLKPFRQDGISIFVYVMAMKWILLYSSSLLLYLLFGT